MANPFQTNEDLRVKEINHRVIASKLLILKKILNTSHEICFKVHNITDTIDNIYISFNNDIPKEFILALSKNDMGFRVGVTSDDLPKGFDVNNRAWQTVII